MHLRRWLIPVAVAALVAATPASAERLEASSPAQAAPKHSDWEEDRPAHSEPAPNEPVAASKELQKRAEQALSQGPYHLSERLPVLDSRLEPGRIFDLNLLTGHAVANEWQRIPPWLAGIWRVDVEVVAQETGFRVIRLNTLPLTMREHESRTFGMQRDPKGVIWHYTRIPRLQQYTLDGRTEFRLEMTNLFTRLGVGRVANFVRFIAVRVEDSTGVILDTRQQENLAVLGPLSDKQMRIWATMHVFDTFGNAAITSASDVSLHRVKSFSPLKNYHGENMPRLFAAFLAERGGAND